MSLLFVALGFFITEKNAKNLLAGYNTMSKADREKFDIKSYLSFFKKFHIFLGVSFLVISLGLIYFVSEKVGILFFAAYPILAYIYFGIVSRKNFKSLNAKKNTWATLILIGVLLFVVVIFVDGLRENKLIFDEKEVEITGSYGETLEKSGIKNVELVEELPKISRRTNGFAVGSTRKGYFKTKDGEIIKLFLNSKQKPIVLITLKNGKKIYYSLENGKNKELANKLKEELKLE